jgi:hypothetical protein
MGAIYSQVEDGKIVQYLRFDGVKERERKLCLAGLRRGLSYGEADWADSERKIVAEIYRRAGLKELK